MRIGEKVIIEECAFGVHTGMKGKIDQPFGWFTDTGNSWKVTGMVDGVPKICYAAKRVIPQEDAAFYYMADVLANKNNGDW